MSELKIAGTSPASLGILIFPLLYSIRPITIGVIFVTDKIAFI
jgi:hypothetical protein